MYSQQTNEKPLIVLRLWIFKFIRNDRDDFAVCVEGYRKKDFEEKELENWRSTAVKERCDSNLLRTVSDSKYVLHGVIDHDSAYALGYPRTLIERFKDGFPPDWQELLCDYYNTVVKPNKFNTSQKIFSSLLSSIFLDKSKYSHVNEHRKSLFEGVLSGRDNSVDESSSSITNNRRRENRTLIKEKIVEEDDECSKSSASTSISSRSKHTVNEFSATFGTPLSTSSSHTKPKTLKHSKPNCADEILSTNTTRRKNDREIEVVDAQYLNRNKSQDDTLFKLPLLPVQRRRAKPIELYSWTIRFSANYLGESKLFPNFAFVIIGFRPDKNMDWSTSCIVAVEGNCLVRTVTGDYKLIGPINTMIATQQGFPKEFIAHFLNGFPKDWHRILSVFFNTYIEPQILPQQSLTISEIRNDDEAAVNVQRGDFSRSIRNSSSSDEIVSDSNNSDSDEDSFLERNHQSRKEERKFAKNHNLKKSVHYWTDTPYFPVIKKRGDQKSRQRRSRSPVIQKKRIKLETNVSGSLNASLLRTRSGRIAKPRLATWAGERIVYNVRGSPIKTVGIITDSVYSTSTSDASLLSVEHEKTSGQIGRRLSLPKPPASKIGLVAYSDSSESFSSESNDADSKRTAERLSLTPPVTPFYGRRGPQITRSRVVKSSSPEVDKKTTRRHHRKSHKRQARTRKRAAHEQKSKPKKVASLTSQTVQAKKDEGRDGIEEAVPIVSFSDVESEDNGAVNNKKDIDNVPNGVARKARISKAKKWTENDNTRLKLAVQAVNPNSEKDWEDVAKTMRTRTARECRKQALEILKLKITSVTDHKAEVSNQVVDALQKTRVGTLAYQIQADRFTQQYLRGGDGSDFFEETMDEGPSRRKVAMMPSVTTFDSDDSLLAVLRTPTPRPARRNNRRKKLTFHESSSYDSPTKRSPRISEVVFKLNSDDEAYREQQLRYAHKMMKIKRKYLNANITRSSAVKNYTLNLPVVESHREESDKESEDEYFEEESD